MTTLAGIRHGGTDTCTGVSGSGGKDSNGASQRGIVRGHGLPVAQRGGDRADFVACDYQKVPRSVEPEYAGGIRSRPENVTYNMARWA